MRGFVRQGWEVRGDARGGRTEDEACRQARRRVLRGASPRAPRRRGVALVSIEAGVARVCLYALVPRCVCKVTVCMMTIEDISFAGGVVHELRRDDCA